jgi:hypothetical protein
VTDTAAELTTKAHDGATAALAGARATADEVGPGCPASRQPAPGTAQSGATLYVPCTSRLAQVQVQVSASGSIRVGWQSASGASGPPVVGGGAVWSIDLARGELVALAPSTGQSLAGGECIDDAGALGAGGTARVLGFAVKAASTLDTFLRSLRWGQVRQLDAVTRHLLARAWAAEAGPMYDEPIVSHWHGATLDRAPSMSTRNDRLYDVSSAKLDALVDIARGTPGVIASRMTGAGFGDYTANLVWSDAVDRVRDRIEAEYPARSGCHPRVSIVQAVVGASEEAP